MSESPAISEKPAGRRYIRTIFLALSVLTLLVIVFYAEENWRGKRAWEKYKHELEAKGEHLDWEYFIPPPVPDGENFFKAPQMKEWFQRTKGSVPNYPFEWPPPEKNWSEATNLEMIVHSVIDVDYPATILTNWFDTHYVNEFRSFDAASERTQARLDDNYLDPFAEDRPNLIGLRQMAQVLTDCAEAHLLTDRSDLALLDLTRLRRLMDVVKNDPRLTCAMVRVATGNLYFSTIADGFNRQSWDDGQIEILQRQLQPIKLLPEVDRAFRGGEVASINYCVERLKPSKFLRLFIGISPDESASQKFHRKTKEFILDSVPRGWIYRNQIVYTRVMHEAVLADFDVGANRIYPKKCEDSTQLLSYEVAHLTRSNFLACFAIPSFYKVVQTVARAEVMKEQLLLCCAAARFQHREGHYPERLEALVPQFIEKLPADILSGKPFVYHRLDDKNFLLYSVGWDEVDNGGTTNDWVWPDSTKWQ
jgi:hypothetical protein